MAIKSNRKKRILGRINSANTVKSNQYLPVPVYLPEVLEQPSADFTRNYASEEQMKEISKMLGIHPKLNLSLSGPASMHWALQQKARQERELFHTRHRRARLTTTAILTAGTIINSGSSLATSILSTDTVSMKQQIVKGSISSSISGLHALGTITGNPYLFAAAYGVGLASDLFGQKIENNIQRKGDAKRLAYNFKNNDYNRFGNKVYNSQKNEWVAEDANKVKRRVLGQKTSV